MNSKLKKIILAEDDADIREVIALLLGAVAGYTVESCSNGVELVERARDFDPDLILCDVMMPEMDGPEAIQILQADPATSEVPFVFITAAAQEEKIREYLSIGALDVVTKPFRASDLASHLAELWADWMGTTGDA